MITPPPEDYFYLRVLGILGGLMVFTPLVRWIAGYLREARMKELRDWFRTEDGCAFMAKQLQNTLENDKRYMYDYLDEWLRKWFKEEMERRVSDQTNRDNRAEFCPVINPELRSGLRPNFTKEIGESRESKETKENQP
jgi:hypothetical protein